MVILLAACVHEPLVAEAPDIDGADLLWFDLEGRDRIDLIESCQETCPRDELDRPVASLTTWAVDWTWVRGTADTGTCAVLEPTVVVDVTVTLPRWQPPSDADPALVEEWRTYHASLRRHEEGHVDLVHALADGTSTAIQLAGCDRAHQAGAELLDDLRSAQRRYDQVTQNGRTQGASFWGM